MFKSKSHAIRKAEFQVPIILSLTISWYPFSEKFIFVETVAR